MKKILLLCTLFFCFTLSIPAQPDAKKVQAEKKEYDGLLPVLGYLGGKLAGELKTRFNLDEEGDTLEKVKTPVHLKIGSFEVETVEMTAIKPQ